MSNIDHVVAFDIETVPDVEFGRRLHGLDGLTDKQVGYVMQTRQREQTGTEFLSLEQQRIVAISIAMRTREGFEVWSIGEPDSPEAELVRRFFDGLERLSPTLVSWNGAGFDLPVLNYRALRHRIQAHRYWEMGDEDHAFRSNNYISRYHWRHVDLMDVISGFQGRGRVGLDNMAQLLGFPRQARHDGAGCMGGAPGRAHRGYPPLLRDGRQSTRTSSTCASNSCEAGSRTRSTTTRSNSCGQRCAIPASRTCRSISRRGPPARAEPTDEAHQRRAGRGRHRRPEPRSAGRGAYRRQDRVRRRFAARRARRPASHRAAPQLRRSRHRAECCRRAPRA